MDLEFETKKKFQQSPANYNPSFSLTMPAGNKWAFGSEKRKSLGAGNISPGAGTYQIPSKVGEGSKFVMGAKLNNEENAHVKKNPGPGQYDLQNKDNSNMHSPKKFSMGSSQRGPLAAKSIAPGPGNYGTSFIDKQQSPRFGFGSGSRSDMSKKGSGNVPGPGAY